MRASVPNRHLPRDNLFGGNAANPQENPVVHPGGKRVLDDNDFANAGREQAKRILLEDEQPGIGPKGPRFNAPADILAKDDFNDEARSSILPTIQFSASNQLSMFYDANNMTKNLMDNFLGTANPFGDFPSNIKVRSYDELNTVSSVNNGKVPYKQVVKYDNAPYVNDTPRTRLFGGYTKDYIYRPQRLLFGSRSHKNNNFEIRDFAMENMAYQRLVFTPQEWRMSRFGAIPEPIYIANHHNLHPSKGPTFRVPESISNLLNGTEMISLTDQEPYLMGSVGNQQVNLSEKNQMVAVIKYGEIRSAPHYGAGCINPTVQGSKFWLYMAIRAEGREEDQIKAEHSGVDFQFQPDDKLYQRREIYVTTNGDVIPSFVHYTKHMKSPARELAFVLDTFGVAASPQGYKPAFEGAFNTKEYPSAYARQCELPGITIMLL